MSYYPPDTEIRSSAVLLSNRAKREGPEQGVLATIAIVAVSWASVAPKRMAAIWGIVLL